MIKQFILNNFFKKISIEEIHNSNVKKSVEIFQDDKLKFIESSVINKEMFVLGESFISSIKQSLKTVPYDLYEVVFDDGKNIICADNHIFIKNNFDEVFAKKLHIGDYLKSINGYKIVSNIIKLDKKDNMYDLELDGINHCYYTNDVLSHNTQTTCAYLLWYAIFIDDADILIASKTEKNAIEILDRIKSAYEELPSWIKPGVEEFNKKEIKFDNGARLQCQATSDGTGRGFSLDIAYLDEMAFVPANIQHAMWTSIKYATSATKGKIIISSTPQGDTDLFAKMWRKAISDEKNGFSVENPDMDIFKAKQIHWYDHPERDQKWYDEQKKGAQTEEEFRQEVLCVDYNTQIDIDGSIVKIGDLFEQL